MLIANIAERKFIPPVPLPLGAPRAPRALCTGSKSGVYQKKRAAQFLGGAWAILVTSSKLKRAHRVRERRACRVIEKPFVTVGYFLIKRKGFLLLQRRKRARTAVEWRTQPTFSRRSERSPTTRCGAQGEVYDKRKIIFNTIIFIHLTVRSWAETMLRILQLEFPLPANECGASLIALAASRRKKSNHFLCAYGRPSWQQENAICSGPLTIATGQGARHRSSWQNKSLWIQVYGAARCHEPHKHQRLPSLQEICDVQELFWCMPHQMITYPNLISQASVLVQSSSTLMSIIYSCSNMWSTFFIHSKRVEVELE